MPRVLLLIAGVRSGRVGGTVGDRVERRRLAHDGLEIDRVDLADLRQYVRESARAWSARALEARIASLRAALARNAGLPA